MSEYLSKKAVLEWFGLMHLEYSHNTAVSEFIESGIEIFESGAFDVDNTEIQRLRAALEKARQYVVNGYELGYIDDREGYTEALVRDIDEALSTTTEPTNAAKVELVREPVAWFAQQMEAKLRENDHRGGWANCRTEYLVDRLYEEYHELLDAVEGGSPAEEITREAADVANFAMMIADNARRMVEGVGNDA